MQYRNEEKDMNRWGMPGSGQSVAASSTSTAPLSRSSTTTTSTIGIVNHSDTRANLPSNSPTDSENNNQPPVAHIGKLGEPEFLPSSTPGDKHHLGSLSNSTVSAAADSSDNQPPTPQPTDASGALGHRGGGPVDSVYSHHSPLPYQSTGGHTILGQEMHHYPTYMHGYDQYYHPPPPSMDYATQSAIYASQQQLPPGSQEYKVVPSPRYHPYMNNGGTLHSQHNGNGSASANASSNASNSSLSPRVVSSSSPTQNAIMSQSNQDTMSSMQSEQTGNGPKICDKCGVVCQTHAQLSEHYSTAHGTQPPNDRSSDEQHQQSMQSQYPYQPYIKEEPQSDILDLDSQKMVYPPQHDPSAVGQEQPLPPMHSMHPMHRSLMWTAPPDLHSGYMPHSQPPPPDMKPYYSPLKQSYPTIKQEYPGTIVPGYNSGPPVIKSEFNNHPHPTVAPQTREMKSFNADITSVTSGGGNPVTSSPSEFPSTTTPQENGGQYRQFEPPTSSLPSNTSSGKSSSWKSNEARRPKTYNCTACNKWFTSSGHLKRHYNTTLHKNAVKSSGQPDPATLPISVHHHPARDPNSKHHHHRNSQGNQPPPAPPEPPRSPDYSSQYTPPPSNYNQSQQGFQQYTTAQQSSQSTNGHPNGQAGPSVRASLQQRGLLIISNTAITSNLEAHQDQEEQMQHLAHQQQQTVEDPDPYTHLQQQQVHQQLQQQEMLEAAEAEQVELQQQVINTNLHRQQQQQSQEVHIISMSPQLQQHMLQQQLQEDPIISTMDTSPTTTIINTMDQQFIITSPLAINTNITQSYQPLQHPGEHQLNYHTITGNDSSEQLITTSTLTNADQLYELAGYGLTNGSQQHEIVTVQRLPSGGLVSYHDSNMSLPYTPIVPESCIYATQMKCERSPEAGDVAPEISPYSPTITSTKTIMPSPTGMESGAIKRTASGAAKRRRTNKNNIPTTPTTALGAADSSASYGLTVDIPTTTTTTTNTSLGSPTGEIRCDECNKVFTKICYLTQHNKTFHNGEQPFRCNRCGKRFSDEAIFEAHYAKHNATQKPHQCNYCPKQFHHKTDLRRHLDSHTGRKAFVCETCSKGFTRRDHLRKHGDTHKPKPPKPVKIRSGSK